MGKNSLIQCCILFEDSVFAKVKRQETRDCVMTSLLHNNIRRLLLLRNLGNKCLAWKYVLGNNKLRGYPLTEQSAYQSFLSRVQAVQSLHKFHQACDLFDEPRKKNTGKIEHYLPNQRVQRKKTHLRPRPHVSGYF